MRISIICGEYHRIIKEHLSNSSTTNISTKIDIEKIFPSILKSTRPHSLCSTLIIIIVYLIMSCISPISCIRYIGLTLILYICINYNTLYFFFIMSCYNIKMFSIPSTLFIMLSFTK
jgi:hypothetical protein